MKGKQIVSIIKAVIASFVVTTILLLILTWLLYKFDWDEQKVTAGIIVIYVISTFVGGFLLGKLKRTKRFLWGLIMGLFYFIVLFLISFLLFKNFDGNGTNAITTLLLCSGGGMLGGMLA